MIRRKHKEIVKRHLKFHFWGGLLVLVVVSCLVGFVMWGIHIAESDLEIIM